MEVYTVEQLGRMAALYIAAHRNKDEKKDEDENQERELCNEVAVYLASYSAIQTGVFGGNAVSVADVAWEAARQLTGYGAWSGDDIREVKILIKRMLRLGFDSSLSHDAELEVFETSAKIMAAILVEGE